MTKNAKDEFYKLIYYKGKNNCIYYFIAVTIVDAFTK